MAVEFVDVPELGRRYRASRRVQLGDVDGRDEMHLEAFGRFFQDVAADDALDARLSELDGVWVVRRYDLALTGLPSFGDMLDLVTFCSGTGPCWAERRTSVTSGSTPVAEAVALWVFANRAGGRPLPLTDAVLRDLRRSGRRPAGQQPPRARPPSGRREQPSVGAPGA